MKIPKTGLCPAFTRVHKVAFVICGAVILIASMAPFKTSSALTEPPALLIENGVPEAFGTRQAEETTIAERAQESDPLTDNTVEWQVQPGDTLSGIFLANKVSVEDLHRILAEDAEYLSLETLTPGTLLGLEFDDDGRFYRLTLNLDPARKVAYTRQEDGSFVHQKFEADTYWESEVLRGTINGSFYNSALRSGLDRAQILLVDRLLGSQLDFRRDLRAGDHFTVILGHEMTGKEGTGNIRLEALSLARRTKTHSVFLFDDGNYYDENGESVTPAFLRWPTSKRYRVSSAFNPNRLHPVTGRRTPHNGVDLATPVGTPIVSTGDGIVRRIGNHPYAGKYIDIDHGGAYTTRYLHLHKVLVSKGAQVSRGQKIALSGNTGRSTGPHLHFEFHIGGRPVDPLTADIPTAAAIPREDLASFKARLKERQVVMKYAASRSDLLISQPAATY
ncbi:peptidoglycan DD-metalloendopeptidase family protein [Marinobacter sp. F3R11]|uniref:peptidoglycan DD-metalloendopeptidase family protein n=1 Tax=Marinobacter sp. F3R11 TaxID=2267231 RepID=UPI000DE9557A|nr:peptidoglycan DD-metalloendopeptidase family protein [Marinobacter sp. F3R11]RBW52146.1 hypothetical protein DS878_02150 [Marinobacter sp. F3R11]